MSSIAMRNSFSVPSRMEKGGFVDLERQLQQKARIQDYNDASMASSISNFPKYYLRFSADRHTELSCKGNAG